MDNYRFDVTADLRDLKSFFPPLVGKSLHKFVGYAVRPAGTVKFIGEERPVSTRLIIYWATPSAHDFVPFARELSLSEVTDFAHDWLVINDPDDAEEDDEDITCRKGFRLYNEAWGHIENEWQACAAISAEWALYGK